MHKSLKVFTVVTLLAAASVPAMCHAMGEAAKEPAKTSGASVLEKAADTATAAATKQSPIPPGAPASFAGGGMSWVQRGRAGLDHVRDIVAKVWPYVVAGIALGAGIHGYVPEDFMASFMGKDVWWAVPAAVVLGVPMYTNAAGIIPVVEALIGKGAALGTILAFMMSVIALSAPEMIILRKALKPRLIATFAGVVALGILLVGYVFNAVL